jgi:hypothetical protein
MSAFKVGDRVKVNGTLAATVTEVHPYGIGLRLAADSDGDYEVFGPVLVRPDELEAIA